ncbi:DNA-directed RNA polymerase subunit H [Candidatus Woesearchaeota archaeon]|jgi:DNA-directed RNA polymerase subunit H|nr:DNA-directed RNA polymerase subunit H [Candidatus Woesearchaeota archaeon]MBT6045113.1 DNA-directed RNA polymerase subunit H [Candidatus Woesearchaeota archaeon]
MAEEKTSIKHNLIPKQEVCTEEEVKEILSKYNIKIEQLPLISFKDPSIAFLDLEPGAVIKIHRSSKTEPSSLFYRLVI